MTATTVFTAGQVLSASALNGNFDKLPYAYSAGTGVSTVAALAAGSASTVNITYPASRFSQPPIVFAWTDNNRYVCSIGTNTVGSAIATVRNISDGAASGVSILYWTAVQMTSGTAAG
jgi:hypothetical protein